MCWGSKLGNYLFEGQRGLEIFVRDLILAMIDHREATDKSAVHIKDDSFWPRFILDQFFLVQISNDAYVLSETAILRFGGLTAVGVSLFVNHGEIFDIEIVVDLQ